MQATCRFIANVLRTTSEGGVFKQATFAIVGPDGKDLIIEGAIARAAMSLPTSDPRKVRICPHRLNGLMVSDVEAPVKGAFMLDAVVQDAVLSVDGRELPKGYAICRASQFEDGSPKFDRNTEFSKIEVLAEIAPRVDAKGQAVVSAKGQQKFAYYTMRPVGPFQFHKALAEEVDPTLGVTESQEVPV